MAKSNDGVVVPVVVGKPVIDDGNVIVNPVREGIIAVTILVIPVGNVAVIAVTMVGL